MCNIFSHTHLMQNDIVLLNVNSFFGFETCLDTTHAEIFYFKKIINAVL